MAHKSRVVLLRHQNSTFDKEVIGRRLQSDSNLIAEIVIEPNNIRQLNTLKHQYKRSGVTGLIDALALRIYHRYNQATETSRRVDQLIQNNAKDLSSVDVPSYTVSSPNNAETKQILTELDPDVMVARTKVLLEQDVYEIPTHGTLVIHPGLCPEYRNQHGCFWALANGERERVAYSLLQIDDGIDTGSVLLQSGTSYNPRDDSHIYIQYKVVADNLDEILNAVNSIDEQEPIDTKNRESALWGMPTLSAWITWKHRATKFNRTYYDSRDN
jgi:methionyl-tRNA formyltransferase